MNLTDLEIMKVMLERAGFSYEVKNNEVVIYLTVKSYSAKFKEPHVIHSFDKESGKLLDITVGY